MSLVPTDRQNTTFINRLRGHDNSVAALMTIALATVYFLGAGLIATTNPMNVGALLIGLICAILGGVRYAPPEIGRQRQIEDLLWPACIGAGFMVFSAAVAYVALLTGNWNIVMPMIGVAALVSLVFMICARIPDLG